MSDRIERLELETMRSGERKLRVRISAGFNWEWGFPSGDSFEVYGFSEMSFLQIIKLGKFPTKTLILIKKPHA